MGCPAENRSFISQRFYSQLCNFRNSGSVDLHLLMTAVGEVGNRYWSSLSLVAFPSVLG